MLFSVYLIFAPVDNGDALKNARKKRNPGYRRQEETANNARIRRK